MAWHRGRKITALYVNFDNLYSWIYVDGGIGWKQLYQHSENAHINMMTVATHAKADDRFVDVEEEPAGFIKNIYVW